MPMNRSLYPDDWEAISHRIRFERAGGRCEECGAAHGSTLQRFTKNGYPRLVKVILTTHHKGIDKPDGTPGDPNDKMDNRDENLAALCQRCHLEADRSNHLAASHQTRRNKKQAAAVAAVEAGQLSLFEGNDRT